MAESAPTVYDVAKHAGVSIATVSRVLNGHDQIRPETRERVLSAVRDLRYVPNGAARSLSQGLKRILGLVFAHTPGEDALVAMEETSLLFTDTVIRGAEWSADRHGYSLLLMSAGLTRPDHGASLGEFIGKVDGLILLDRVLREDRVVPLTKRVPVVLLAGSGRSRSAVTVRCDNEGGMRALAKHLVGDHGLRRTAFVAGFAESPDNAARGGTFASAVTELGGTCEPLHSLSADWTASGAAGVMQRRLESQRKLPEVIACANDQMAMGVIYALAAAGFRVPEDVAVTGFDDIAVARYMSPPLTTIRQPSSELGAIAIDSLVKQLGGVDVPRDVVLATKLILRRSCGCRTASELSVAPDPPAPDLSAEAS
jgi:LacI family transcriptional regulator